MSQVSEFSDIRLNFIVLTVSFYFIFRDIKPENILVDQNRHVLKLCDFGCAKKLVKREPHAAYICSRYYRAPEVIVGATDYTTAIDMWAQGCVIAELFFGNPIFPGGSNMDQLVEIVKVTLSIAPTNHETISCLNRSLVLTLKRN